MTRSRSDYDIVPDVERLFCRYWAWAGMNWPVRGLIITERGVLMPIILIFLLVGVAWPTQAAGQQPTSPPRSPPPSINIRTSGDLAEACTVAPTSKASFARLNFCNGFAQGVLQTNSANSDGTKICMPNPAPKRGDTMKEFANWVRTDAPRRVEVASVGFLRFMANRFPCR